MIDPSSIGRYVKALTYSDSLNSKKPEDRPKESAAELKNGQEGKRDGQACGENGKASNKGGENYGEARRRTARESKIKN